MHVLLLASAFNSLTQRTHTALRERGHWVAVHIAEGPDSAQGMREAVRAADPDLILAPMLTVPVPDDIWQDRRVLIVHPGPPGDRGPSSLDWALHESAQTWGVTVLQADKDMDAGDIWAHASFEVGACGKSELYRGAAADAALEAILLAVARFARGDYEPVPLDYGDPAVQGRLRPYHGQAFRAVDWTADDTATVLRKLRTADSQPGVLDELFGQEYYLHGGHAEERLSGAPGEIVATRDGAVCRATTDGAVWIPQLRRRRTPGGPATWKLPATTVLGDKVAGVPEFPLPDDGEGWSEIRYEENGRVGRVTFAFPGGAMSTDQCRRLLAAYQEARTRPTDVLLLGPRTDFFSNGIHLGVIEAATDPAAEAWANINAMDDLAEAVLTTTDRLTVATLPGNAAAGGLMLALAADEVWCREASVLNPHYRLMGLHGSEYWTYSLPRRVGAQEAARLTEEALPVGAAEARRIGLVDHAVPGTVAQFDAWVERGAAQLAGSPLHAERLRAKRARREADEADRPLASYREDELRHMKRNFYEPGEPHPALRSAFVRRAKGTGTPEHIAGWLPPLTQPTD
ncbi:enoyl-CoA hydratase-related protein [Streptomyces sp. NPDC048290]|uniref:enoyl-CoA hydratase-related protein n=1 Tax=Streptomyces sp. NPDC048290 TaxID=3155811 RepID=UPI003413BEDC